MGGLPIRAARLALHLPFAHSRCPNLPCGSMGMADKYSLASAGIGRSTAVVYGRFHRQGRRACPAQIWTGGVRSCKMMLPANIHPAPFSSGEVTKTASRILGWPEGTAIRPGVVAFPCGTVRPRRFHRVVRLPATLRQPRGRAGKSGQTRWEQGFQQGLLPSAVKLVKWSTRIWVMTPLLS